jgi:hypothetical protein
MSTSTTTRTFTRTHTATFLTDIVRDGLTRLLEHLGVGATSLINAWCAEYQDAIHGWMEEQSLRAVVLECTTPQGAKKRFDFTVDYTDGTGGFRNRMSTMVDYYAKVDRLPAGTTWRIVCQYSGPHSPQRGWSSTTLDAASGLTMTLGTVGRAPHANLGFRTYGG